MSSTQCSAEWQGERGGWKQNLKASSGDTDRHYYECYDDSSPPAPSSPSTPRCAEQQARARQAAARDHAPSTTAAPVVAHVAVDAASPTSRVSLQEYFAHKQQHYCIPSTRLARSHQYHILAAVIGDVHQAATGPTLLLLPPANPEAHPLQPWFKAAADLPSPAVTPSRLRHGQGSIECWRAEALAASCRLAQETPSACSSHRASRLTASRSPARVSPCNRHRSGTQSTRLSTLDPKGSDVHGVPR